MEKSLGTGKEKTHTVVKIAFCDITFYFLF